MAKPELTEEAMRLRQFIDQIGLKGSALAEELKLDRSFVSKYLNGALHIPITVIKHLNHKHGLSFDWFFNGITPMQKGKKQERSLQDEMGYILTSVGAMEAQIEMLNRKVTLLSKKVA